MCVCACVWIRVYGRRKHPLHILNREKKRPGVLHGAASLRTRCGKFDEDAFDNCPFQATPDMNNVRHTSRPSGYRATDTASGQAAWAVMVTTFQRTLRGHLQDGGQPGRPAQGSLVTHRPWPVCSLVPYLHCCIPRSPGVGLFLTTWSRGPGP